MAKLKTTESVEVSSLEDLGLFVAEDSTGQPMAWKFPNSESGNIGNITFNHIVKIGDISVKVSQLRVPIGRGRNGEGSVMPMHSYRPSGSERYQSQSYLGNEAGGYDGVRALALEVWHKLARTTDARNILPGEPIGSIPAPEVKDQDGTPDPPVT